MPVTINGVAVPVKDQPGPVINVDPATGREINGEVSAVGVRGVTVTDLHPTVPEQPSLPTEIGKSTEIAVVNHAQAPLHDGLHGERLAGHEPLNRQALAIGKRGKEHLAAY